LSGVNGLTVVLFFLKASEHSGNLIIRSLEDLHAPEVRLRDLGQRSKPAKLYKGHYSLILSTTTCDRCLAPAATHVPASSLISETIRAMLLSRPS
jgi:hypothetical protein